jgi:hypothetical protein
MSKTFEFISRIDEFQGTFRNYALFIPAEVLALLPQKGRIRMEGTMNGYPFNLAIQSGKEAGKFFAISAPFMRSAKLKHLQEVKVVCSIADPEKLEVPEEFAAALELDEKAAAIYQTFSTGLKRSILHYVISAKSSETKIKRSLELMEKFKYDPNYLKHKK